MKKIIIKLAQANGVLDKLRRAEIEKRVAERYTPGQEFRLFADKEEKPEEWAEHEAFIATVKAEVDAEFLEVTT